MMTICDESDISQINPHSVSALYNMGNSMGSIGGMKKSGSGSDLERSDSGILVGHRRTKSGKSNKAGGGVSINLSGLREGAETSDQDTADETPISVMKQLSYMGGSGALMRQSMIHAHNTQHSDLASLKRDFSTLGGSGKIDVNDISSPIDHTDPNETLSHMDSRSDLGLPSLGMSSQSIRIDMIDRGNTFRSNLGAQRGGTIRDDDDMSEFGGSNAPLNRQETGLSITGSRHTHTSSRRNGTNICWIR